MSALKTRSQDEKPVLQGRACFWQSFHPESEISPSGNLSFQKSRGPSGILVCWLRNTTQENVCLNILFKETDVSEHNVRAWGAGMFQLPPTSPSAVCTWVDSKSHSGIVAVGQSPKPYFRGCSLQYEQAHTSFTTWKALTVLTPRILLSRKHPSRWVRGNVMSLF